jgi:predicted RNA binding protein YcfA (HicA-like mRNA interferase family)
MRSGRLTTGSFQNTEHIDAVKVRDLIRMLEEDGWVIARTRGSHRDYNHAVKRGPVTVPGKPGDDLAPRTLNSALKQAGLK